MNCIIITIWILSTFASLYSCEMANVKLEKFYRSNFDIDGYYQLYTKISLSAGIPGTDVLFQAIDMMENATVHRMQIERREEAQLFQYGRAEGNTPFRLALAEFLTGQYGDFVNSQDLALTGGASLGLWLIMTLLFRPGDVVFVEDPTYNNAINMFNDYALNIITVDTDEMGIRVNDLERKIQTCCPHCHPYGENNSKKSAMLYLIPVFHNPTGRVTSAARCRRIVEIARQYNLLVVADDVYNLIYFDDYYKPPKRLFAYDKRKNANYTGSVISNGSFSKFAGPGFRLGWLEAPKWFLAIYESRGPLQGLGGLNIYASGIMASAMNLKLLEKHAQMIRENYQIRKETAVRVFEQNLPPGSKISLDVKGGYYLWIELPTHIDAEQLLKFAVEKYQVEFITGISYSAIGNFRNFLRIAFTFHTLDVLKTAILQLCRAIEDYQRG